MLMHLNSVFVFNWNCLLFVAPSLNITRHMTKKKKHSKCFKEETEICRVFEAGLMLSYAKGTEHFWTSIPWKSTCAVWIPLAQWFIARFLFYLLILLSWIFKLITKWTWRIFMDRHWAAQEVQIERKKDAPNKWVSISFSSRMFICMP